jgi:hypothetical protein
MQECNTGDGSETDFNEVFAHSCFDNSHLCNGCHARGHVSTVQHGIHTYGTLLNECLVNAL